MGIGLTLVKAWGAKENHCSIMKRSVKLGSGLAVLMLAGQVLAEAEPARVGQAVYEQHCAACHGINGEGNGAAAVWLYPKPRRFNSGLFKIRSTPSGFLPT